MNTFLTFPGCSWDLIKQAAKSHVAGREKRLPRQVTVLKHSCQAFLCRVLIKLSYLCTSTFAFAFQTNFIVSALERGNLDDDLVGIALFEGENSNARRPSWFALSSQEVFFIEEDSDHQSFLRNWFDFNTQLIFFIEIHYAESIKFPSVIIGRACFCFVPSW